MTTIAQAFNAITVAQGGTPKGGTIVDAIDALTDTLAGSDQPKPQTIADAVTLLGQHIGGGGGGSARVVLCVAETGSGEILSTGYGSFTANGAEVELSPLYASDESLFAMEGTVSAGATMHYTLPDGYTYDYDEDRPYIQFFAPDADLENDNSLWSAAQSSIDPAETPTFNAGGCTSFLFVAIKSA